MNRFISRPRSGVLAASILLVLLLSACGGEKPDAMLASARAYLAKNDDKAAAIQLKNALQENPDLAEARYLLGLALLRGGEPVGGETELRKALALKHPPAQVVPALARAMLAQGLHKKLTDEFARTDLGGGRPTAELQTSLAAAYDAEQNVELARAALNAALAADPAYAPALVVQAQQKAAARDYDAAQALVDGILAKTPADHEALQVKADIQFYGRNQADEALATYRKAVEAKADFAPAHSAIINMLLQQGKVSEATKQLEQLKQSQSVANRGQIKYLEALIAYRKNDIKTAREAAQQMIKLAPNYVPGLQLAGAIELQANSLLQAEAYLAKAVQAAPEALGARRLLVSTYLRSGQSAKALAALQPALKGEVLDASILALAGEIYFQIGDNNKAEEYFGKSAKQDPKNTRTRTALALTHLGSGKEEAGFAELQDIAASDTGTTADMTLISALVRRNQLDKALQAIDRLEKKQPDARQAAHLRGRVLLAKKDAAGARKSFERSLAADAAYFPSVASLAAMDLADNKPDEARKRFEAVLAKDANHVQALLALAELRSKSGGPKTEVAEFITRAVTANPTDKDLRLLLVDFHLRYKDYKLALSAAQSAVAAVPGSPELLDALGRAQQLSGDTNQAIATFNQASSLQPLSPLPHMRIAEAQLGAKNREAATQSLRKALDVKPDLIEAQRGLLMLAVQGKNYQDATAIARNVQKQRPKEPVGYEMEGDIAAEQKKWDVAADAYRSGLKAGPFAGLAIKLVSVLGAAGKTAELDKFSAGWFKDHPKDTALKMYMGDLAIARNDLPAAERYYLNVTQIESRNAMAYNNLAWVAGRMKKDGAIAYAEKAVALAPNQPAMMDTLATLLSEKNDYAKALEWQTKAVALQPGNGNLKVSLAKIHIKGGNKELARKELDELAKLGDKFRGQAEVAALLKSL